MNRNQKLAALAKVLQATDSETAVKHLKQVKASQPPITIIVDDFGGTKDTVINDSIPVRFMHEGTKHRMPLGLVRGWLQQQVNIKGRFFVVEPEV